MKRSALRRANDEDAIAFSSREERLRRARNADDTMEGAFWTGVGALGVGLVLLTTGIVVRARAEAPRAAVAQRRRASMARVRVDAGSGGLRLRF